MLEQDPQSELRRAAVLQQADGLVEVYVLPAGEDGGRAAVVAGPLERLHAPALDPLFLGLRIYDAVSQYSSRSLTTPPGPKSSSRINGLTND